MKLAINGGKAIRHGKPSLPYSRHYITKEDIVKVWRTLDSGWIAGNGNASRKFEEILAEYTGYKYAIVVNSATSALYLSYMVLFRKGSLVSMPALTFVATANAAKNAGLIPSIQDVERRTLVNEKSHVTVSYSGFPVINGTLADDAHYIYPNMASFKRQQISCISFHPVKHMTTGEGGAVLTNDVSLANEVRLLANHGRQGTDCIMAGWNFRMPDFNAALGISQLGRLSEGIVRKKRIAHKYQKQLSGLPISLPAWHKLHAYHLYVIQLPHGADRDEFRKVLLAEGIGSQVHYPPLHTLSLYKTEYSLKNIDNVYPSLVSIPIFASMKDSDVTDVIEAVQKVTENLYE